MLNTDCNMKKEITLLYLFLLVITQLSAQHSGKAIVEGFVQDEQGQAVDFANVLLLNPADTSLIKGAITDSTGYYVFENLVASKYLIQANLIGYQPVYTAVFELNEANPTFRLPADSNILQ